MAQIWHAFYFNSFDSSAAPSRTAMIEADNEDQAGQIAVAQMGRSLRVDVTRPIWHGVQPTISIVRGPHSSPLAMPSEAPAVVADAAQIDLQ
jgi:hypothetical protein